MKLILFKLYFLFPIQLISEGKNAPCETFERIKKEAKKLEN